MSKEIIEALEKANTMLTGYGCNNTSFLRDAIKEANKVKTLTGWKDITSAPRNKEIWVAYISKYSKKYHCVLALYAEKGKVEVNDDEGYFDTYNEDSDMSTLPEGWYREAVCYNGSYDNLFSVLSETPLFWQEKPEPPILGESESPAGGK